MSSLTLEGAIKTYKRPSPSSLKNLFGKLRGGEATDVVVADTEEDLIYALNGIDLQIDDGESLSVLGPSGCGKTTLLRALAGLEFLDEGKVRFDGEDVTTVSPQERNVAMVFQDYALYPHWPSQDNLGFFFKTHQRKHEIPERVRLTAQVMGLGFETLLSQKPPNLSGGQQQRVAIGRAIIRDPRAFLFDEPLSNLDATVRARTRVEVRRLIQRFGITSVYVTHDQSEAFTMGDRIAVMREGRILQVDTRRQLIERPLNRFVADFITVPAMNLLPGVVHSDYVEVHDRKVIPPPIVLQQYQFESITIGIRPLDVELRSENEEDTIPAKIETVEPLMSERSILLTVRVGRHTYRIQRPQTEHHEPDTLIFMEFPAHAQHVFDRKGRRVN
jgi:ABC-type sugar transport system ATPase subunit